MKKISFLIAFLFLSSIICFSQDEHFDPLDELGSGYGNRDMEKMQDPKINFPTTKDYEEMYTGKKINRNKEIGLETTSSDKKFDFESYKKGISNNLKADFESLQDNSTYAKVSTFDTEATNYKRFENSPCFNELGFNPNSDMQELEKRYLKCEQEHNTKTIFNIGYVLIFLFVIYLVVYFSIPKDKRIQMFQKTDLTKK
jgi:hypothetical protein